MAKLQGDFSQRVEFERKMKERHDLNIQQPFPDSEEGTPTKEKIEVKKKETLAQKIEAIKRMKSIAPKKKAKRPRTEEDETEQKQAEHVQTQEQSQEQSSQQPSEQSRQSDEQFDLYMTVTDKEPLKADPITVKAPEIIHWDTLMDKGKE
ncbi:hypothetical protein L6452_21916 [Arctium lappa]|uniref:Uncharacterized protein n=1 Tax=Arctium lappa TaxID=4217 RepID=A0ACB9AZ33_ARCLA|nr:hypothetical protein L6452_21916 [Arctium lappa]